MRRAQTSLEEIRETSSSLERARSLNRFWSGGLESGLRMSERGTERFGEAASREYRREECGMGIEVGGRSWWVVDPSMADQQAYRAIPITLRYRGRRIEKVKHTCEL